MKPSHILCHYACDINDMKWESDCDFHMVIYSLRARVLSHCVYPYSNQDTEDRSPRFESGMHSLGCFATLNWLYNLQQLGLGAREAIGCLLSSSVLVIG